jgi:hypothetical protein
MKQSMYGLFLGLLFTGFAASAQVLDQGNFMIGSTVGFSVAQSSIKFQSTNTDDEASGPSSAQFTLAPNVGYFPVDNFVLGLGMNYTFSSIDEPNEDRNEDSNLLFGPFMRYYFPFNDDTALFFQTDFGFGNASDDLLIAGQRQKITSNIFALGIGPGFTIFSDAAIGIEALFKYNFARSAFDTDIAGVITETTTRTNQFDLSIGIQFYFGGVQKVGSSSGNTRPTPARPGF